MVQKHGRIAPISLTRRLVVGGTQLVDEHARHLPSDPLDKALVYCSLSAFPASTRHGPRLTYATTPLDRQRRLYFARRTRDPDSVVRHGGPTFPPLPQIPNARHMPSRFTVVDDPLRDARACVESAIDAGHAATVVVTEGATAAAHASANATTEALRWINGNVEWQVRVVCILALLCLLLSSLSRCAITRLLLRRPRRAGSGSSKSKSL